MRVLVLGADGFIGRHIAFRLRAEGHAVLASARRTGPLARMGFEVLCADLTDPATHDPAFWRGALAGGVHLVNAAGLLTGSEAAFAAVHEAAPRAAYHRLWTAGEGCRFQPSALTQAPDLAAGGGGAKRSRLRRGR